MKNLIKISVLALAATALMVSCSKETKIDEQPASKVVRTFTCTFAEPATKVAIGEGENLGKTTWEVGDQILVHGEYTGEGKSVTVTLTADDISADGKTATISVEGVTPYERLDKFASTIYAGYPASLVKDNEHCYYYTNFTGTNKPLMAAYNDGDVLVFYNLTGIITFKVTGDFDKFVLVGNNNETVGYSYYRTYLAKNLDSAETPARLDFNYANDGGTSGGYKEYESELGTGTNYVYLANGVDFTGGFTIKFFKGDELKKVAKTETAVNVARNKILELGDITEKLADPAQESHTLAEWAASATNLGATETANSYIISAAGAYKIPAVKGNSNETVGEVDGAALLWETYNSSTEEVTLNSVIAAVDYDADYIYFKTPDTLKPGNALVAAKNTDGDILWSWHIWIPATAIKDLANASFYNRKVMDRNLGALNAVPDAAAKPDLNTFGLYYQWGRKDPMFTSDWKRNGTLDLAFSGNSDAGVCVTTEESIKHPTTYYYNKTAEGAYNWNESEVTNLWDDSSVNKTIYDPCPAGYRVPKHDDSFAMWKYNVADGWTSDATNGWFKYGDITFPYAGYASGSSLSYSGVRSVIWSAKYKDIERGYAIYIRSDKDPIYNYHSYYKPYLGSVRCCMIDGVVENDPEPSQSVEITIDGNMSDWAEVTGGTSGNHEFKVVADDTNVYFYSHRSVDSRYGEIWGGGGYVYVGFDLDGNAETGETLNGKGPYEFVFFVTPYGGSAEAPAIADDFLTLGYGADCLPSTATVEHIVGKGAIDAQGVAIEFSIPRADMPTIPTTAVKVVSVGNKDLASVSVNKEL